MNKFLPIYFLLSFKICLASGQGINNNYLFGYTGLYRGTMNLITGTPIVTGDSSRNTNLDYTHANISDANGNLLFYTNGAVVMDCCNDTMPNGTGLSPCAYTTSAAFYGLAIPQATLILPDPSDSNKYYLFHQSIEYVTIYSGSQVYYSRIDMTLNGGKGDVVQKNISFYQDTLWGGGLTACKHANGRDWWLVVPKGFVGAYHVFLVSPAGVQYQSTQYIGSRIDFGQCAFSPDGNHYGFYDFNDQVEIFHFDRCTGVFSKYRYVAINDSNWGVGFCFSPNSKLAYSASARHLYQYNLDSANLSGSKQIVAE